MSDNLGYNWWLEHAPIRRDDLTVLAIRERYQRLKGRDPSDRTIRHYLYRALFEGDRFGRSLEDVMPEPPTNGDAPHVTELGAWNGHFLTSQWFFPPAVVAKGDNQVRAYCQWLIASGYTHVLFNAQQDDWGPSKGRPEWTAGGLDAHRSPADLDSVVRALKIARRAGLTPLLGVFDQQAVFRYTAADLVAWARKLVDVTWPWVSLYMLAWEHNEVLRNSVDRERWEDRLIGEVDWHGRDVGLHYSAAKPVIDDEDPGLGGGVNRYHALQKLVQNTPSRIVRLLQYHNEAPRHVLEEQTRRTAGRVHADTGHGAFCAFEFASEENQPRRYTPSEVRERRMWIRETLAEIGLTGSRWGMMN